jgi:hypothetical protein
MTMSGSQKRLRFDHAELREDANRGCVVEVTFTFGELVVKTSAAGECDGIGPLKTAAAAAIKAIEQAVDGRFGCSLADLDHVNALGKDLIAVLVNVSFEDKQVQVFGSCQISGNEIDSAVKATLNATNRFFELAMRG